MHVSLYVQTKEVLFVDVCCAELHDKCPTRYGADLLGIGNEDTA
jgi:hypothetical protein